MAAEQTGERAHRHLFCFGLGYSARALVTELHHQGWRISGTGRDLNPMADLPASGAEIYRFDRANPLVEATEKLAHATHILSSVPPDDLGDSVLDCHGGDIAGAKHLQWIGYLSTTGVYGDTGGAWVDETSDTAPSVERSRRRVDAEQRWLDLWHTSDQPVHVFRLAGIYGPGRNPLETARSGRAKRIDKPGHVFSRIHVGDIVRVLLASIAQPHPGAIYNVCDNVPAPQADVVAYACELLGLTPPPSTPLEQADLSPMAQSFYADNRRVSNARIKRELGVRLRYPDYRAGLSALLADAGPDA